MDIMSFLIDRGLVLIPVLNVLGMLIKTIDRIPNKYIPLILLFFGILGAFGMMGVSVDSAIQGVLVTGAAVYGNQVVKQIACKEYKQDDSTPKE